MHSEVPKAFLSYAYCFKRKQKNVLNQAKHYPMFPCVTLDLNGPVFVVLDGRATFVDQGAESRGREESRNTCTTGTNTLGKCTLKSFFFFQIRF